MTFNHMPSVVESTDSSITKPYTLSIGQSAQGNISNTYDYDYFTIAVTAGQTYSISLIGTGQRPMVDPNLVLLDTRGLNFLSNNNITDDKLWSELEFTAITTGNMTIKVGSSGFDPGGQYGLSVSSGPQNNFDHVMGAGALYSGDFWGSGQAQSITVSYGFRDSPAAYSVSGSNIASFSKLNSAQKDAVNLALNLWSDICGIKFQAVNPSGYTNNATILFGNYLDGNDGAGAFAYRPGSTSFFSRDGDVWLNLDSVKTSAALLEQGKYSFMTIMHEIGHALGLTHPGPYNAGPGQVITYSNNAKFVQDSGQYTLMSYFDGSKTGQSPGLIDSSDTPMLFDILAMQNLYGANMQTRSSDTVYGFNSNVGSTYDFAINTSPQMCIWDAGGTDTLNCSGYSQNQLINLGEGSFSNVGGGTANVSIALNVTIENAIGGTGSDTIFGNSANNSIQGNNGNDLLYGGAGNDEFDWDVSFRAGNDTMYGGLGDDVYVVDSLLDNIVELSNEGKDSIWSTFSYSLQSISNVENLYLFGTNNIDATGNSLDNILRGNDGNNIIDGAGGIDTVYFTDARSSYTIQYSNGMFTARGNQGTDTIKNIEFFSFSDVNISSSSLIASFNPSVTVAMTANIPYTVNSANLSIMGTSLIDKVVIRSSSSNFEVRLSNSEMNLVDKTNTLGVINTTNVERIKFTDISLALDVGPTQNAGSVYMLYKAAFNRPSDAGGMGYWISLKDGGANIVTNIAQGFVNSAEFIAKYGANPTNLSYVSNLYQNVLGRAGEAGGVAYWTGEMDAGRISKAQALASFATLPEGAGIVAPLIANGIQYQEFLG
jgi:serralysin